MSSAAETKKLYLVRFNCAIFKINQSKSAGKKYERHSVENIFVYF